MRWFLYRLFGVLLAVGLVAGSVPIAHAQGARSIDINLSTQTITAYEGSTPVYSAGVSSGRPGLATPTGNFSIVRRVYDERMVSSTIGIPVDSPLGYDLSGIYFTQYFDWSGDALHYNYWSPASAFGGYPTSHGCVGMQWGPAEYFWNFASIGTPVSIHY